MVLLNTKLLSYLLLDDSLTILLLVSAQRPKIEEKKNIVIDVDPKNMEKFLRIIAEINFWVRDGTIKIGKKTVLD